MEVIATDIKKLQRALSKFYHAYLVIIKAVAAQAKQRRARTPDPDLWRRENYFVSNRQLQGHKQLRKAIANERRETCHYVELLARCNKAETDGRCGSMSDT